MTGDEFIQFAGLLAANAHLGHAEARFRSAASRAYYGAFHLAVDFLAEFGIQVKANHTGHREAYNWLWNCGQSEAQEAARILDDLRSDRNEADYRLDRPRFRVMQNAQECVMRAGYLKSALDAGRNEPLRSAIQAGLEQYERERRPY